MKRVLALLTLSTVLFACTDVVGPAAVDAPTAAVSKRKMTPQDLFARYVALGTSNSMGVQAAGIFASGQRAAWPAQLAARSGALFAMPLVENPGCPPGLLSPLAVNLGLLGAFSAFGAGEDLVTAVGGVCMPLQSGIVLPTQNLAISGATAHSALHTTPELEAARNPQRGVMYSRVLTPDHTQVSAMLAWNPTLVSVELAANEVLPAATGRTAVMTPFADWQRDYDQIIEAVRSTGAPAVLVGLPDNAANFPSVRRARELYSQWPYLLTLGIRVSVSCYFSSNYLFTPGYILTLLSRAPTTATCADEPGKDDFVLTSADVKTINDRMAQMNAHIVGRANENGYAFFKFSVVYDQPKVRFSIYDVLFSSAPFGPYMSLDGVHPNARGQGLLADAAAQAISARYGVMVQ
jgi:lysophospholipase L1-like esterase